MKKRIISCLSLTALVGVGLSIPLISHKESSNEAEAYDPAGSLPSTIILNDNTPTEIRNYYSSLNSLSESERSGDNLLKNLKTILKNNQQYFVYDDSSSIWKIYEIADRDWDKSPASSTTYGTYDATTNTLKNYQYGSNSNPKNDPYVHALYVNRNVENQTKAWGDHTQTNWGINREHVWPKAEGFEDDSSDPISTFGGARGDPMHLMAGNGYANNIHSNYFYGYVNKSKSYTDCGNSYSFTSGNLLGSSLTVGGSTNIFEPQDSDKGDIARAIFYMVARYNYLSGSDSDGINRNNPNLALSQSLSDWSQSAFTSTTTRKGYMGIMTDLLAWHKADPVDEFEIHRNNLLFNNYTKNRNPFIDFPEWADYIWGTTVYNGRNYVSYNSNPTGYASPLSDTINGYNQNSDIKSVTVSPSALQLDLSGTKTGNLTATVTVINDASKVVTWTSSNANVATVNNGVVTAVGKGTCTIYATSVVDHTKMGSSDIAVIDSSQEETTVSVNIGEYAVANSWTNATKYTSVLLDSKATASVSTGGGNTGKYYESGSDWRFYQSENAALTISVPEGYELESVTFTFDVVNTGQLNDPNGNAVATGQSVSVSGTSATFTVGNSESASNGQIKFKSISVTYYQASAAEPELLWNSPYIDVYSGAVLTASDADSWNVIYKDEYSHLTPLSSSQFTVLLDNSSISLPYTWKAEDDDKTLCVSYNDIKSEITNVAITQTLRDINKTTYSENESSLVFTEKYATGGATTDDSKTWAVTSDAAESVFDETKGIHYGTSGKAVSYVQLSSSSYTSGKISKVVVNGSGAYGVSGTISVTIGGVQFGTNQTFNNVATEYTFTGEADAGQIVVRLFKAESATGAIYCKSIVVTSLTSSGEQNIANNDSYKESQRAVVKFAKAFNSALGATNSCTTGLSSAWEAATSAWNTFLSEIEDLGTSEEAYAKDLIKYATAKWTKNTDNDYSYCLERALATYDKCVSVHGMTAFMNYVRETGRVINNTNTYSIDETSDMTLIITIISAASISAFLLLVCLKKKRNR